MDCPKPLVSILIPCYNAERWIRQCIESALEQSYPNKEVIVIDDGSTDASAESVERFGDAVVFQRLSHAGGNAVRNELTRRARGEWLQYLDADDYLLPDKIASQMESLAEVNSPVDVVYSPVVIHDDRGEVDYVYEISERNETLTFIRWGPFNTGGLLLRRQTVIDAGSWNVDLRFCQEHDLLLRLMLQHSRFLFSGSAGAVYRQHGNNTVSRRDPLGVIKLRMEMTDQLVAHLKQTRRWTPAHTKALFVARMECARTAGHFDPEYARQLSAKAKGPGIPWVTSPALPFHYQVISRIAGFKNAERLARLFRPSPPRQV
jgi:glycosyltransferase involved in cell wall biosynthesis